MRFCKQVRVAPKQVVTIKLSLDTKMQNGRLKIASATVSQAPLYQNRLTLGIVYTGSSDTAEKLLSLLNSNHFNIPK